MNDKSLAQEFLATLVDAAMGAEPEYSREHASLVAECFLVAAGFDDKGREFFELVYQAWEAITADGARPENARRVQELIKESPGGSSGIRGNIFSEDEGRRLEVRLIASILRQCPEQIAGIRSQMDELGLTLTNFYPERKTTVAGRRKKRRRRSRRG